MVKTTKINIGIALSRNYNKISLEFLDEPIEHNTHEELIKGIRDKFNLLREMIEKEFGTEEKPQAEPPINPNEIEKASVKQKSYLKDLGFNGDLEQLNKEEAKELIKTLLNKPQDY